MDWRNRKYFAIHIGNSEYYHEIIRKIKYGFPIEIFDFYRTTVKMHQQKSDDSYLLIKESDKTKKCQVHFIVSVSWVAASYFRDYLRDLVEEYPDFHAGELFKEDIA